MDTESGKPTQAKQDMTLDELSQLEAKGQNPNAGFENVEPQVTAQPQPEVKPTDKEPDWKNIAQTEQGRLKKLQKDYETLTRQKVLGEESVKRLNRLEKLIVTLGEAVTAPKEENILGEPMEQKQQPSHFKEFISTYREETAAEQFDQLLQSSGLSNDDARLAAIRRAPTKQEQLERLQAALPFLSRQEEPQPASQAESVSDIEARVRRQVLAELGKVDVGASGAPGRSSFADYARDFASGKISREEYRDAKKKYGVD